MEDVYAAEQHADDIKRVMLGQYDHGYSIGMGPLTDRVFHLTSSGGLVVVTGIPNSGKTDFLNCMMAHLIFHCHKRVGFFSFELPDKAKHFTNVAQVGVGVDDPRQHIQAGGVDDPVGPHLGAAWEEAFHPFPGNEDVQRAHGSGINDDAVCDQSRTHGVSPVKHPLPCPAA